jgi:YggT family protein
LRELLTALFIYFISPVLWLLMIIIIIYVVLGWLIVGGVVSQYNPTTRQILRFTESILNPMLRPIRRIVPPIGQLDLSVFVLALVVSFLQGYAIPRLISLVPI